VGLKVQNKKHGTPLYQGKVYPKDFKKPGRRPRVRPMSVVGLRDRGRIPKGNASGT